MTVSAFLCRFHVLLLLLPIMLYAARYKVGSERRRALYTVLFFVTFLFYLTYLYNLSTVYVNLIILTSCGAVSAFLSPFRFLHLLLPIMFYAARYILGNIWDMGTPYLSVSVFYITMCMSMMHVCIHLLTKSASRKRRKLIEFEHLLHQ